MVFGYHFNEIRSIYRKLPKVWGMVLRRSLFATAELTILASFFFTFGIQFFNHFGGQVNAVTGFFHFPNSTLATNWLMMIRASPTYNLLLSNREGLLRLPLFFGWFATLFYFVRRYEDQIMRWVGWLLLPLGRNSLYVYICSEVLAIIVPILNVRSGFVVNTIFNVAAVSLLWLAVRYRLLFWLIPR